MYCLDPFKIWLHPSCTQMAHEPGEYSDVNTDDDGFLGFGDEGKS